MLNTIDLTFIKISKMSEQIEIHKLNPQEGELEIDPARRKITKNIKQVSKPQNKSFIELGQQENFELEDLHSKFFKRTTNESKEIIDDQPHESEKITLAIKGMCEAELVLMKDLISPYFKLYNFWQKNGFVSSPFIMNEQEGFSNFMKKIYDFLKVFLCMHSARIH